MLIERARRGLTVVRLKGRPFIFGRAAKRPNPGRRRHPLRDRPRRHHPLGIAAYTGVPLTYRELTSAVTFVTGHAVAAIDWDRIGRSETLVIFMGLTTFPQIARELMAAAVPPKPPPWRRWATRPDSRPSPARSLPCPASSRARHEAPATIIVGEVVRLRDKLNWYERLPLFGSASW